MARYIDADKLRSRLYESDFHTPDERWRPESEFAELIDTMPAADVEEVVRCKECKHWTGKEYVGCCQLSKIVARHADDFCSYGKRRKTNNEENRQ